MTISAALLRGAKYAAEAAATRAKKLDTGDMRQRGMIVVVTRGKKLPKGTTGTLSRWGESQYGHWVCIKTEDGVETMMNERNVTYPKLDTDREATYAMQEATMATYRQMLAEAVAFTGLDLKTPINKGEYRQHAWSDTFEAEYACNAEASDELLSTVINLLDSPGSSWGALRWSGGSSLSARVSPTVVRVMSSTNICD